MRLKFENVVDKYIQARNLTEGTRCEYVATVRKWNRWNGVQSIQELDKRTIREFLELVHEHAIDNVGKNPGRTTNKARAHLRAVLSWAWEFDLIENIPRFPKPWPQRDVAGRYYLTKTELNSLYFATYQMKRPKGWKHELPAGAYWRTALTLFFSYGLDTGTIWKTVPCHEPILWRHITWDKRCPDGQTKGLSRWGWIFYRRVKTGKTFYRPLNRVVAAHIKKLESEENGTGSQVFRGGGSRPNLRFQQLCEIAGIKPKTDIESGEQVPWSIKDLRKTCATHNDEHIPESSIEILGHSVGGITYRHYARRDPLAFKAIMTLPQPSAFSALPNGIDGECPCCRRTFLIEK